MEKSNSPEASRRARHGTPPGAAVLLQSRAKARLYERLRKSSGGIKPLLHLRAGKMRCGEMAMSTVKTVAETGLSKGPFRAARGTEISCKGWQQEAALRMLMNNLDPEVAEKPEELVVYGGTGKAARNWECFHAIVRSLKELAADETLLVQSGKPVAIFRTHEYAPRVLLCNSNLVGHWNNWDRFHELDRAGLIMYGQMTAGS